MEYLRVHILISSDVTLAEVLVAFLANLGFEGMEEFAGGLDAYIQAPLFNKQYFDDALNKIPWNGRKYEYQILQVPETNWNAEWEKNYPPVLVSSDCRIRAPFHHFKDHVSYDLVIEPKMAFGTGHHETTFMMMRSVLPMDLGQKKVLDVGTGTGVLAMLAVLKGARHTVAIDNDEHAYTNAKNNFSLNEIQEIRLIFGDILACNESGFDLIMANISRNILLSEMPQYASRLVSGGVLLISGFLLADRQILEETGAREKLVVTGSEQRNDWLALILQKGV